MFLGTVACLVGLFISTFLSSSLIWWFLMMGSLVSMLQQSIQSWCLLTPLLAKVVRKDGLISLRLEIERPQIRFKGV